MDLVTDPADSIADAGWFVLLFKTRNFTTENWFPQPTYLIEWIPGSSSFFMVLLIKSMMPVF